MGMTYVGSQAAISGNHTSSSLANAYAPTSGNVLILVCGERANSGAGNSPSLTDTRGNVIPSLLFRVKDPGGNSGVLGGWIIPNCIGGAGTFTANTGGNAVINFDIYEYAGNFIDLDGSLAGAFGNASAISSGNLTTQANGDMLFACGFTSGTAASMSFSGVPGFNQRINSQNTGTATNATSGGGEATGVAAGTYSSTATVAGAGDLWSVLFALSPYSSLYLANDIYF
jgi:hypothetical protein